MSGFMWFTSPDLTIVISSGKDSSQSLCCFRFEVNTLTTTFGATQVSMTTDWVHMTLVYYGPTLGTSVFLDGKLATSDLVGSARSNAETQGHVFLGREYSHKSNAHSSEVTVDEMYFWEIPLKSVVIEELYNSY